MCCVEDTTVINFRRLMCTLPIMNFFSLLLTKSLHWNLDKFCQLLFFLRKQLLSMFDLLFFPETSLHRQRRPYMQCWICHTVNLAMQKFVLKFPNLTHRDLAKQQINRHKYENALHYNIGKQPSNMLTSTLTVTPSRLIRFEPYLNNART